MRGEVLDDADVAHAVGERADALGARSRKTSPSWPSSTRSRSCEQRRVEALDVADGGAHAGRAHDVDDLPRLVGGRGQRLLDQHVDARGGERADGRQVLLGRHRDDREVRRAAVEQLVDRARSTRAGSCTAPKRSPPGSTAPAKRDAGMACRMRAWWRPIMPRPSTAPRSGSVGSRRPTAH